MNPSVFRTSLDLLHYSGLGRAARPFTGGLGAIFMLHHVRPPRHGEGAFAPNAGLNVTPDFLDAVLAFLKARRWRFLSLRDAATELRAIAGQARGQGRAPFAVFTLDDGFRDNMEHAWPVFRRHGCPFTIFAAPRYVDGEGELWWDALEEAIASHDEVRPDLPDLPARLACATVAGKKAAWEAIYWPVRGMEQHAQRRWVRAFAAAHGIDLGALCRREIMNWEELRRVAADPLCDIGAHTMNHYALALLEEDEAFDEMVRSRQRLEAELGCSVPTFAYPYGDASTAGRREFALAERAGFRAAVTTRKGLIHAGNAAHMTALPRVSLNGFYQKLRHVDVLLTGLPFLLFNRGRLLDVG